MVFAHVSLRQEEGLDVEPIVDAPVAGDVDVGGRGVEDALPSVGAVDRRFALKEAELAGVVVDEEVGAEDGLVATEDDARGGNEGEVLGKPLVLGGEAGGYFHGGGGDKDVVAGLEAGKDALGVGHDTQNPEEVLGEHVAFEVPDAGWGNGVPEPAAVEIFAGEGRGGVVGVEVAVVAEEVLAEGVRDDFVHVYGDDLAGHAVVVLRELDAEEQWLVVSG